ncbi:hypothetical protein [Pseudopontixanthobacter vadosimaris]|uniref:hypothetical protein n=1 Tax=Pseudopontixanthobacter vadosimaris TaxID=2726450 RepID=UPI0014742C5E|nr:hypothetical protein [Pseudopontixanthobacter vadosimaris]
MDETTQMCLAAGLALTSVVVLRISWARRDRSWVLNLAGRLGFALSTALAWAAFGAWGVAVVMLVATGAAIILLAVAALEPASARRRKEKAPRIAIESNTARTTQARIVTFLIAGPFALIASLAAALAARLLVLAMNGTEADANVTVLGLVPLLWAILSTMVLMNDRRRTQIAIAAAITAVSAPFLVLGGAV